MLLHSREPANRWLSSGHGSRGTARADIRAAQSVQRRASPTRMENSPEGAPGTTWSLNVAVGNRFSFVCTVRRLTTSAVSSSKTPTTIDHVRTPRRPIFHLFHLRRSRRISYTLPCFLQPPLFKTWTVHTSISVHRRGVSCRHSRIPEPSDLLCRGRGAERRTAVDFVASDRGST